MSDQNSDEGESLIRVFHVAAIATLVAMLALGIVRTIDGKDHRLGTIILVPAPIASHK